MDANERVDVAKGRLEAERLKRIHGEVRPKDQPTETLPTDGGGWAARAIGKNQERR